MKFQWPPGLSVWKKGLERDGYVLLVVAVGIVLLLWPQGGEKTESATQETVQEEQGSQGDSSTTTVTVGRGSGSQDVVPLQTVAPQFRGALVVCPGGDDPQVRLAVMEAVSAVPGLGSNHISVCKSAA